MLVDPGTGAGTDPRIHPGTDLRTKPEIKLKTDPGTDLVTSNRSRIDPETDAGNGSRTGLGKNSKSKKITNFPPNPSHSACHYINYSKKESMYPFTRITLF